MKRILIVDDMPSWLRFHTNNIHYLNIPELHIDTAESAKQALAKIEVALDTPYDIIFTDMQMESDFLPKLSGEWLIEQIQMFKEYRGSKIVIISASQSIKQIAEKYNVDYLPKASVRNSGAEIYAKFIR